LGSLAQRVRSISSALETHLKCEAPRGSQRSTLFPRLKTVAVCSIYGRHSDKWGENAEHHSDLVQCRLLWARFLSVHRVEHCCYRDVNGPLGLPEMEDELYDPEGYYSSPILHLGGSVDRTELRTPPGVPFRWVADMAAGQSWEELFRVLALGYLIRGGKRNRMDKFVDMPGCLLRVDIYCSSGAVVQPHAGLNLGLPSPLRRFIDANLAALPTGGKLSVETQRAITTAIGEDLQARTRADGWEEFQDEVRWHASCDTPICEACGWHPVSTADEPWFGASGEGESRRVDTGESDDPEAET
jgi:hypothetical protein